MGWVNYLAIHNWKIRIPISRDYSEDYYRVFKDIYKKAKATAHDIYPYDFEYENQDVLRTPIAQLDILDFSRIVATASAARDFFADDELMYCFLLLLDHWELEWEIVSGAGKKIKFEEYTLLDW